MTDLTLFKIIINQYATRYTYLYYAFLTLYVVFITHYTKNTRHPVLLGVMHYEMHYNTLYQSGYHTSILNTLESFCEFSIHLHIQYMGLKKCKK